MSHLYTSYNIIRLLIATDKTDEERLWRILLTLFLDGSLSIVSTPQLLTAYNKKYGRKPKLIASFTQTLESEKFQIICEVTKKREIVPSVIIQEIFGRSVDKVSTASVNNNNNSIIINNNMLNNNNNNIVIEKGDEKENKKNLEPKVELALSIVDVQDINPNNPFLIRAMHEKDEEIKPSNPFLKDATLEKKEQSLTIPTTLSVAEVESQILGIIAPINQNTINNNNNIEDVKKIQVQSDLDNFANVVSAELECLICYDILKQAVESNCCKALCCEECVEMVYKKKKLRNKCPNNCENDAIVWTPNEPIRRIISKKPVKCDIESCGVWTSISDIDKHKLICEHRPIKCDNYGCDWRSAWRLLADHQALCGYHIMTCTKCSVFIFRMDKELHDHTYCEHRPMKCNLCLELFPLLQLSDHEKGCDMRKMSCKNNCGKQIVLRDLSTHETSECLKRRIFCPNQGCHVRDIVSRLEQHMMTCPFALLTCKNHTNGCDKLWRRDKLNDHAKNCKYQKVHCNRVECKEKVLLNNLKQHRNEECRARKVSCSNVNHGCQFETMFILMPEHELTCEWILKQCPNKGCNSKLRKSDYDIHLMNCANRRVDCTNEGCAAKPIYQNFNSHVNKLCEFRQISCNNEGCTATFYNNILDLKAFEDHCKTCAFKQVICPNNGCKQLVKSIELEAHKITCAFQTFPCPNQGCQQKLSKSQLIQHAKTCLFVPIKCTNEGCPQILQEDKLQKHLKQCKYREEKCRNRGCIISVPKINMEKHQSECLCTMWNCRVFGCPVQVMKKDLHNHELICKLKNSFAE